jgi:FAD/FMN-containing dehydrogenase
VIKMANITKVLGDIVGSGNVSDKDFELVAYSRHLGPTPAKRADAIVLPGSAEDVSEVLRYANRTNTPVYVRGGGTGVGGMGVARAGGILLDLCRMDKILDINEGNATITTEAGCSAYKAIKALRKRGYRLALWPESGVSLTMGGWTACSASGINQYFHGYLWDSLVGLEVVLPTGEIVRTGLNAWSNCGPIGRYGATGDIQGLFEGSLGAFGVITETTYTIYPDHEAIEHIDLGFDDWEPLIKALRIFRETSGITDVSFLDSAVGKLVGGVMEIPYPLLLSLACTGTKEEAERAAAVVREIGAKVGAKDAGVPIGDILYNNAALLNSPSFKTLGNLDDVASVGHTFDVFPEIYRILREVVAKYKIAYYWYAWVLKNGVVSFPAFAYKEPEQREDMIKAREEISYRWTQIKDVPPTTYFGASPDFTPYLRPTYYELVRKIKRALDPNNILQPGLLPH